MEEEKMEIPAEPPQLQKNEKQVITAEQRDIIKKQYKQDWYKRKMANKVCTATQSILCGKDICHLCKDRSFANHHRSIYWSPKNAYTPIQVPTGTIKMIIFDCPCGHEFSMQGYLVRQGSWCKYCCTAPRDLCENLKCVSCFEKSAASHPSIVQWSLKNNIDPRFVFKKNAKKYVFDCTCGHEYTSRMFALGQDGSCPYCSGHKICTLESCKSCFNASFASSTYVKYWLPKNEITPRDVMKSSTKMFWFKCDNEHEFQISLWSITTDKAWCKSCSKRTEQILLQILKKHAPDVQHGASYDWCRNDKTGFKLPFDFVIESMKLIIELDGNQHFEQIICWSPLREGRRRDWLKMRAANANGYTVIRLVQTDVRKNINNWYEMLISKMHVYDKPDLIFISEEGRYNDFENMLEDLPDNIDADVFDDE